MRSGSIEFVDTNILVYEWDYADTAKQAMAAAFVLENRSKLIISSQVAQEFAKTVVQRNLMTPAHASLVLESYRIFGFVPVQVATVQRALITADESRINFWDALIVEAAAEAKCKVLWTEDLNHGQTISGVRVRNPFL